MKQRLVVIAAALILLVGLVSVLFVAGVAGSPDATAACTTGQVQTVDVAAVGTLDQASLSNAGKIIGSGHVMQIPERGLLIALMTAWQESTIHNLANTDVPESLLLPHDGVGHDHDSVGVMQQRPSWGTLKERMTVEVSTRLFYTRLAALPHWQQMSLNDAAQAVQISGVPDAYGKWETLARQLLANSTGNPIDAGCVAGLPASTATGAAKIAVDNAQSKLGTSYVFGGDCTMPTSVDGSHHCDCSSLVQTAWQAAGKQLPRTSEDQYLATTRVAGDAQHLQAMQPGDLLFYSPGIDGRPGLPGHVAMYLGNGRLIEAPKPGDVVSTRAVYASGWLAAGRVKQ